MRVCACAIIAVVLVSLGCADNETPMLPASDVATVDLLPENQLVRGCYNWPQAEFSPTNHAELHAYGAIGEPAIEFTLNDLDGTPRTLSALLKTKPVFLVFGSFT